MNNSRAATGLSRLPFEIFLAWRYLRPKRTFVSVITLISVMGVMLGVGVLIVVLSVMTGLDHELQSRILAFSAHLQIQREDGPLQDHEQLRAMALKNPLVKWAAPYVHELVLAESLPAQGNPIAHAPELRGMDWQHDPNFDVWGTNLVAGSANLEGRTVLIGYEFARQMQLDLGDRLAISSPEALRSLYKKLENKEDLTERAPEFIIQGIFDVGDYERDSTVVITSLRNAQDLQRLGQNVQGLQVMLKDPFQAEIVRTQFRRVLGPDYRISLWTEENSAILDALSVEKNSMFVVLLFIMVVAAFGIMNSLITFVVQKTREIGLLKAIGATRLQMLGLFLSQGLSVGLIGIVTGFVLGITAVTYRNEILRGLRVWTHLDPLPSSLFSTLPAQTNVTDVLLICGSALLMCVVAALIPAWRAGGLRPVEALRHE